ncbi:MAG: hypothetical protein WCR54_01915 [Clostridia bacterium]
MDNAEQESFVGACTVCIKMPGYENGTKVQVLVEENGNVVAKNATIENGYTVFSMQKPGEFAIVTKENSTNASVWISFISAGVAVVVITFIIVLIKKKKKEKVPAKANQNKIK